MEVSGDLALSQKRGRRNAERRTLVTAAAYFPDCRETEAHGNAFQRPAAASFRPRSVLPGTWLTAISRRCLSPSSHTQWQGPVVSPDGNPRPPEPVGANHSRGRRIRPAWVTPPRPSFRSVPLQSALEKRPSTGQDGSDNKPAPGDGDKECEKIFSAVITRSCAPDAAQRGALAERCAAEPGSRLLAMRRNRGPGS